MSVQVFLCDHTIIKNKKNFKSKIKYHLILILITFNILGFFFFQALESSLSLSFKYFNQNLSVLFEKCGKKIKSTKIKMYILMDVATSLD